MANWRPENVAKYSFSFGLHLVLGVSVFVGGFADANSSLNTGLEPDPVGQPETERLHLILTESLSSLPSSTSIPGSPAPSLPEPEPSPPPSVPIEQGVEESSKKEEGGSSLKFAGYLKSIAINSKGDGSAQPYDESLNRMRLKITYDVNPHVEVHVEHDTEVIAGSYLGTSAFQQGANGASQQYWNLGSVVANNRNDYVIQNLYRAYIKISEDAADLTVGRQRIPLGTGLMFSALDMLNPVNPLLIERDEYVGVDAALLEYKSGDLSKFSLVYAPDPAHQNDRWIEQYKTNVQGADLTFTAGKYWADHLLGFDIATQIGNAGVHGEATYTRPHTGQDYQKLLIGSDYAFANTLTISAEAYYSSQPKQQILEQIEQNPLLAQVEPLSNRAAGLSVSYEFTPLLKTSTLVLFDLADGGRVIYPTLSYSMTDNLIITGGMQMFSGNVGITSPYKPGRLTYAQGQWFF